MATMWKTLSLCVVLFLASAGTVHGDVHGYTEKIEAALNASGALDSDEGEITTQSLDPIGSDFNCPEISMTSPPSSVHELTPADIKVVAALGDSITAAMGAKASSIFDGPTDEYRGVSWSIGGDQELSSCTTLPNIIKKYNPNVKGFSLGKGDSNAGLNLAVSGSIAQDLPSQARELVDKITNDPEIDIEEDWKLVTMWIGGNNLCDYCKDMSKHSTDNYIGAIQETLDILQENLPKTFVNLVQILDMTRLAVVKGLVCGFIHWYSCGCATNSDSDIRAEVSQAAEAYQRLLSAGLIPPCFYLACGRKIEPGNEASSLHGLAKVDLPQAVIEALIDSGDYDTKDDFTVVVQPFFMGVDVPLDEDGDPDKSYFAPDCFHFSTKGHRELAVALWNNMIEPLGGKSLSWELGGTIKCPATESPFFYTRKNSVSKGFNSQANSNTDQDPDTDTSNEDSNDHLGVIIGSSVTAYVVIVTVALVVMGVVWWRKRRGPQVVSSPEKISLISKKY